MCLSTSDLHVIYSETQVQKLSLSDYLFDICDFCTDCSVMPSLPQGAFAACKIGEQFSGRKESTVMRPPTVFGQDGSRQNYSNNKKLMEYTPAKYNGKMMNSIWGLYNKYSPHNIKNVSDVDDAWKVAPEQGKYFTAQSTMNDARTSFWDATATFPRH
ncbi:uncharacterized protein DMENIID0001_138540 [Sergentomyia squamirostris]